MTLTLPAMPELQGAIADRHYRYLLWRTVGPGHERALFVMLNPSTADARKDDQTVRRCREFTRRAGAGTLEIVNLFALRATDPADLMAARGDIEGHENDRYIIGASQRCDFAVVAWGALDGLRAQWRPRAALVMAQLDAAFPQVFCLGKTKHGHPRHPSRLALDTPLEVY